jgi:hypothetical protein
MFSPTFFPPLNLFWAKTLKFLCVADLTSDIHTKYLEKWSLYITMFVANCDELQKHVLFSLINSQVVDKFRLHTLGEH